MNSVFVIVRDKIPLAGWEAATLFFAVAAAVFTSVSAILTFATYLEKALPRRKPLLRLLNFLLHEAKQFEALGQLFAVISAVLALLGAFCSVGLTLSTRQEQRRAEAEMTRLHEDLKQSAEQSSSASRLATTAATELNSTKKELAKTNKSLSDTYDELGKSQSRLQAIERSQSWRTVTKKQHEQMQTILAKWAGNFIAINPIAGDNEVHYFAAELERTFQDAGWRTGWTDFMEMTTSSGVAVTEGVELELPSAIKKDQKLEQALLNAIHVIDRAATVRYTSGNAPENHVIHLVVGKKINPKLNTNSRQN